MAKVEEKDLTEVQKQAIKLAFDHYGAGANTVIAGYAGTGKSTIVRFLIKNILDYYDLKESEVTFTAFTGKACQVLTNKGCSAVTLHKLMYDVEVDQVTGDIYFNPKDELPYKLIIVDECSMVPTNMVEELKAFDIPLVFLGDPGQLPPINKDDDNHLLDHPDIFLTEVLRQAQDSPIIRLSMKIRNGESIDGFNFPEAKVINKSELTTQELKEADMILVGTNKMRFNMNKAMRKLLKKEGLCAQDEKIICTHNYWEKDIESSLTNGTVGILKNGGPGTVQLFKRGDPIPVLKGDFISETGRKKFVKIDKLFLEKEESCLTFRQKMKGKREELPREFTYAYAITGHKAQGSEWDNVIIFEENFPFGEDHIKWLYTCVTRAKKKVILVRNF